MEQPVSFPEIAQIISSVSGQSIDYISPEPQVYTQNLLQHGIPEMYAQMFTAFAVAFAANTMNVPTSDLTMLLGRKPTDVKTYLTKIFQK